VIICPVFSGTVRIFNDVSSQFSRDTHLSRFWLGVPDLSLYAHLCNRMLTHQWPKISSDFICIYEKLLTVGALPWTLLEKLMTLPIDPQVGPPALIPYDLHLSDLSRIVVPKLWSP